MGKNIVICSDGTGNSFGRSVSNVARMIALLALDDAATQVVVYDQGIGTDARRWKEIVEFRDSVEASDTLHVLPGPHETWFRPAEWVALMRGLAFGYGLEANVGQMYRLLAELWDEGDNVFLFGFSRGAFTVRALAGLLYRCRLPQRGRQESTEAFDRAWALFVPMQPDTTAVDAFIAHDAQRECPVHFLGLWDTVKSYGGLRPIMLPHLRHNPIVTHVRHALALDEERGWFDATTWGRLDLDRKSDAAWSRLSEPVRKRIEAQDVEEVWFRGCHSDIGGGYEQADSGRIALRWMLGEAAQVGLRMNETGMRLLQPSADRERADIHQSRSLSWRAIEMLPRTTIDNSGVWPRRRAAPTRNARRHPADLTRNGTITIHESVEPFDGPPARVAPTKTAASGSRAG